MKRISGQMMKLKRSLISFVTVAVFLFVYGGGLPFMEIWKGLAYRVEAAESAVEVRFFNSNRGEETNNLMPYFYIVNASSMPIDLKDMKFRYYYTVDGLDAADRQIFKCLYAAKNEGVNPVAVNVNSQFVKMDTPTDTADHYIEIGFDESAGTMEAGAAIRLDASISKESLGMMNQYNDYSFNPVDGGYVLWDKVTVYMNDELVAGTEPYMTATREAGAWYMFDSTLTGQPNQSKDYRGNYGNAVLNSDASIAPGRTRNGLSLDGVDDFVALPSGIVSSLYDFTIAAWVKLDAIGSEQRIFDFGNGTGNYMCLTANTTDAGVEFAITQTGESNEQAIASGAYLPVGAWKHVAVTLSGRMGVLYIDGVEVGRNSNISIKPSTLGSTSNNYIGKSQSYGSYLDGMIDDFQIYDRALSVAEIKTLTGPVTRINDSNSEIVYSSGWNYSSGRSESDYQSDIHEFSSPNEDDYFEYTFTGTGINFIASQYDGNSDADVYIDGVHKKIVTLDGAASYNSQIVSYSILGLTPGTHTIKVVFKNNVRGVIDALDVMTDNDSPSGITLSATSLQENVASGTIVGTLNTTDANAGDTFLYTLAPGEGSNDNASFGIEGDKLKILTVPNYETKNSYNIRIRTQDAGGLSYDKPFVISVTDVNEAPFVNNPIPDQDTLEDSPFSFTFEGNTFIDPEGNVFTYSAMLDDGSALPAWLAFNSATRTFSGTPSNSDVGTINVKVNASDGSFTGSDTFSITVINVNDAPSDIILSNSSIAESIATGSVVGTLSAVDIDVGDSATFTLAEGAGSTDNAGFTIVGNDIRTNMVFDYETKREFSIRVRVKDAEGDFYEKIFTIYITDVNEAPTDITLSSSSLEENVILGTLVGTLESTDPDEGNTFTYSLVSGAGAADNTYFSISGNQLKTAAVLNYESKSSYSIRIRSADNGGLAFEKVFNITVVDVNEAPVLITLIPDQNAQEDVFFSYQFGENTFTDVDGHTLNYTASKADGGSLPAWLSFDSATRTFSGTPENSDVGLINVKVVASDGSLTSADTFIITVLNANDAPTDINLSNSTIPENTAIGTIVGILSTEDVDAGDTAVYTLADGVGNDDNGSFIIIGNELKTASAFDYETKSSCSIRIRTTDSGGAFYDKTFIISITDVNESPSDLTLSNSSIAENSAVGSGIGTFGTVDEDAGYTYIYTLVSGEGDTDNTKFSIVADQLRTLEVFDFEAKSSYSIRVRTTDAGGLFFEKSFTIGVVNVNESPKVAIFIPDQSASEDTLFGFTFDEGTFIDIDGDALSYTAALEDNSPLPAWLSFDAGTRTFSGTPENGDVGVINIKVTASEGSFTVNDIFSITVNNVNDAPTDILLSNNAIPETAVLGTTVGTFSATDVDVGDTATFTLMEGDVDSFAIDGNKLRTTVEFNYDIESTYSITVRATDSEGAYFEKGFTINISDSGVNNAPTDISLSNTTILENTALGTIVGTLTTVDADISDVFAYSLVGGDGSEDNLDFTIDGNKLLTVTQVNYEQKDTYNIRIRSTDAGGLFFDKNFVIIVTDVDEKPMLDNPVADQAAPEDELFSLTLDENTFSDPDGDTIIYTATLEDGSPLPGWLTFNSGTRTFSGTPQDSDIGSINVKVTASDGSLTASDTFTITVSNTNDTPEDITLSNSSILEGVASGSLVGVFQTVDEDLADTFIYSLVAGDGSDDNGNFTINGNELRTGAVFDYESKNTFCIRIRTTDSEGAFYEKTFIINITNINEPPTDIILSATEIEENLPVGTQVANFNGVDPDSGDSFTYALVSGIGSDDNGSFFISGDQLKTNAVFDYETKQSYTIRVRITDSLGLYYEKSSIISIGNAEEEITLENMIPDQNATEGVLFNYQFADNTFRDPDGTLPVYSAVLQNGNPLPAWLSFTPETRTFSGIADNSDVGVLIIKVTASDGSSSVFDIFTITVANVNDAPSDIILSNNSIEENKAIGTLMGILSEVDPDIGDTAEYYLVAGEGDTDNGSFSISGNELRTGAVFDYETKNSLSVRIRVEDSFDAAYEKVFVIDIINVNETPLDISLTSNTVDENLPSGTVIGVFDTVDSDIGDTFSYSLASGDGADDNSSFSINANLLKTAKVFDYETKQSFSIRVRTTDALGLDYERIFSISINNVNEKPVRKNSIMDQSAVEGAPFSFQFASDTFYDPEGDALSYTASLLNGNPLPDWLVFEPGTRTFAGTPSDADKGTVSVRITATDGALSESVTFNISVADVNNTPTGIILSNNTLPEDATVGTIIGTFATIDEDAGDTFVYEFVPDPEDGDNASFSIVGNTLRSAVVFDYEEKNSYSIMIRATDAGGLSLNKTFTISIIDVEESIPAPTPTPTPTPIPTPTPTSTSTPTPTPTPTPTKQPVDNPPVIPPVMISPIVEPTLTPTPTPTPTPEEIKLSDDAYLDGLIVTGIDLSPAFDPETHYYEASAKGDIRLVCVIPYASNEDATITLNDIPVLNGNISYAVVLEEGENELVVKVVAEDGKTIKEYLINIFFEELPLPTPTPEESSNPFFSSLEDLLKENELSLEGKEKTIFDDVPSTYWAQDYIRKLYERGIVKGIDAQSFEPGRPITRAEFTQIIVSSLRIPYEGVELLFNDVEERDWYGEPVSAAATLGIVVGRPDGSFAPNESITRQDVAVVVAKFLEKKYSKNIEDSGKNEAFVDSENISEYASDSVEVVVSEGLMVGKPGNKFDPKGLTTRAEAVTVICKLLKF